MSVEEAYVIIEIVNGVVCAVLAGALGLRLWRMAALTTRHSLYSPSRTARRAVQAGLGLLLAGEIVLGLTRGQRPWGQPLHLALHLALLALQMATMRLEFTRRCAMARTHKLLWTYLELFYLGQVGLAVWQYFKAESEADQYEQLLQVMLAAAVMLVDLVLIWLALVWPQDIPEFEGYSLFTRPQSTHLRDSLTWLVSLDEYEEREGVLCYLAVRVLYSGRVHRLILDGEDQIDRFVLGVNALGLGRKLPLNPSQSQLLAVFRLLSEVDKATPQLL
jgi:hypothetical protein